MKINTLTSYLWEVQFNLPTLQTLPNGQQAFAWSDELTGTRAQVVVTNVSKMTINCRGQIPLETRIVHVYDQNGTELLKGDHLVVTEHEYILNAFGFIDSHAHHCQSIRELLADQRSSLENIGGGIDQEGTA